MATAIAALLLAAPASAGAKPRCRLPSAATVVASSSLAVVYRPSDEHPVLRACIRATARKVQLQADRDFFPDADPYVLGVSLAGRYAGWVEMYHDRYGQTSGSVWVFDLRKGRMRWSGGGPYRPAGDIPEVTDVALAENGRIAFVTREYRVEYPEPDHRPGEWRTVWVRDASGTRALEQGRDAIDLTSLELQGLTATWTSDGQPRSAQLY